MVIPPAFTSSTFPCEDTSLAGAAAPGFEATLSCVPENKRSKTRLLVSGGTPPYIVTTNKGVITAVDVNLFDIKIGSEVGIFSYPSSGGLLEGDATVTTCHAIKDLPGGLDPSNPAYDPMLHTFGERWAYIKLGMNQLTKGIFTQCRHRCSYVGFDCFDRYLGLPESIPPTTTGTTVGQNEQVINPFECPFSYANQASVNYNLPGKGLGPCQDAHDYNLHSVSSYPPVWYYDEFFETPPRNFAECSNGAINPGIPNDTADIAQAYLDMGGPILDVRHPNMITKCTPCALEQGTNITITITDSNLSTIIMTVPIL